jgi:hypothetical protein
MAGERGERARLRFNGPAALVSEMLPKTFLLDPTQRREVHVGREVPPGGLALDCGEQALMISRRHAKLLYLDEGRWKLEDLQSTNGLIHRRGDGPALRVQSVMLEHGDKITFGGAKSTEVGCEPGPKALKSIYSYSFEIMAPCTAESDSESCPSPILSRGHSKASAAEQTVNYSTAPASRAAPSRDSDPQRAAGAQESRLSIADSGAGARGGDSAPESAAADEGAAEPENERDGVGGKTGWGADLVLGPGCRRLCVAEQEHERDGMGEKDGPSENSRPNAHGDAGEKGLGRGVEGKELKGHQGLTGGEAGGTNPDNRGVKRKMVERCEAGVKRGGRKERDKGQIKGNHILKGALSSDFI